MVEYSCSIGLFENYFELFHKYLVKYVTAYIIFNVTKFNKNNKICYTKK